MFVELLLRIKRIILVVSMLTLLLIVFYGLEKKNDLSFGFLDEYLYSTKVFEIVSPLDWHITPSTYGVAFLAPNEKAYITVEQQDVPLIDTVNKETCNDLLSELSTELQEVYATARIATTGVDITHEKFCRFITEIPLTDSEEVTYSLMYYMLYDEDAYIVSVTSKDGMDTVAKLEIILRTFRFI